MLRETRGLYPGLLAQEEPGNTVKHYLVDLPPQGRITESGLITVPIAGDVGGAPDGRISDMLPYAIPAGDQTVESTKQGETRPTSNLFLLGAAALLFFV